MDAHAPQFLVVTAKQNPSRWIFPKGHINVGERPEDAAVRELREETGVLGRPLGEVGSSRFRSGAEDVDVTYYLVRALSEGEATEGREVRWLPYDEARMQLSFEDAKALLDEARRILNLK